ncbi:MAG: FAD-linked oxidoreductase, partial [Actinobacteria bacterium]|nr:FAD-linked oxidoreductase [Actinomycetota bacterium]NIW25813.1 FAD-linked oxidoreductase [Actinomycetota bacterium]
TAEDRLTQPVGGKLPMSFSMGPKVGPNWVAVGDAAGAVNPFNGEGIDYAY